MPIERLITILSLLLSSAGCQAGEVSLNLPAKTSQALVVNTESWDAPTGTLLRMERKADGSWKPTGQPIAVSVGKAGFGWGSGLHRQSGEGPVKKEGDKKAPAGVFTLGTAYGYAEKPPRSCRIPYRQATGNDFFVDDVTSPEYNRWVNLTGGVEAARRKWKSFERMRLTSDVYKLGIVVNHNLSPTTPGAGSAIFIHIWSGPGKPTAGCTAMAEADLRKILSWLDPEKSPVLIQGPRQAALTL